MRCPKYWSFSFSIIASKEIPGLISFRMDWLDHITICKIDSQWEFAVWLRKLKQGLWINLEGWDAEGDGTELQREAIYVYLWLIHVEI